MPLKILYIVLCFIFIHRSLGNGLNDAEQDMVQSLIANQTDLSSIPEISPNNLNVTRRNLGYDRTENEECEKAVTLKRTLKLLISLLSDSSSTNSKTTDVLENLKDLLKNTPAGDAEVLDKIDDLVRTLDKYKEPGDRNDHVPLRSLTANPTKNGLELDSRLKLNLEIPALANIYCTQQLLNILKATEHAYLNLARNPVCEIDVSDLPTIPNINPYLLNPNLQFDDWGKSPNKIPYSQNCENCYPAGPDINIGTPYYYPVFVDVNPDKNPISPHENPDHYDQILPITTHPNKNPWSPYYNLVESDQVRPFNVNPVLPTYYPYSSGQALTVDVNPNKNPGTTHLYTEFFDVKLDKNPLLQDYNGHGPGPKYYSEFFDVKLDKKPLLQDYHAHGPGPNYYPKFIDLKPDKNPLLQDYYSYNGPAQVHPVDFNPDINPGSKYYYPEFFDVTPEKNPLAPKYNLGPGEVWYDKNTATPYYYHEYIDMNLDKNPVAPYYNSDSTPLGPVNSWDKTPFPYDAAPETLPLNPIFPYLPKTPGYPNPNSENQKILPFEITPEAVNFVYPNLYTIPNQSKQLDFSEPSVPSHQYPPPIFPPKEIPPLNPYSLYAKLNYGINPHMANYVKPPLNSVLPYASKIPMYIKPEPIYSQNEVPIPQFPPRHNIQVNAWENSIPQDQNQNIPGYPFTHQKIQNSNPIDISQVNLDFIPNDILEYNIQPNNLYPSYPYYPSNEHEISPLNLYSPYVPDQFRPQHFSSNPGPLIDVVPKPNEQKLPFKIIGFVREAIDVIQAVVPVVKFDRPTLHIIAKIKSILIPKDEDIPHEQYSTILGLFGKVIEYVKQLEYYKQIKDIIDSHAVSNRQKLETEKIVELTYLLKQPKPVVYYPYYYVKYSMPYRNFMIVANNLLRQKPELREKPNELYEELLALSKVVDVSPDLKNYNKGDLLKLTVNAGSLVDTKLIEENDALRKQLNILKNITSDLTTDEILDLKESNNKYQQLADTENDKASVEPFILRDKKEADPNIIIGMQRLNDLFSSPNSHSSSFNSNKLRDDILRGGKDSVNDHLRDAINNRDENNPPVNNWIQKLFEATKEASHPPNVMSSNGFVRIDNQKITMNSGSGNRQDSISVFNPKSTMNLAASNSHDIGINIKSYPNDINEFLKRYNGPNLINYDNQKLIMNTGDSNHQKEVKITNPKLMLNVMNAKEFDSDDLESATEQDGLAIESNPPLKWEQLDTSNKPTQRPGSTKNYKINNMSGSNQIGVINHKVYGEQNLVTPNQPISGYGSNILYYGMNSIPHQIEVVNDNEPLLISNDPTAFPGSVAYYGINGMGMPNQVGGINNEEQLSTSNDPTAVPGSVANYGINGIGMPSQFGGINNGEQLLISNNPTAASGSVAYYTINGMGIPNQVAEKNNEEQLLISNDPTGGPGSVAYYGINGIGMPNQVGVINNREQLLISNDPTAVPGGLYYGMNSVSGNQGGVLGSQSSILHQDAEQIFPYELEHIVDAEGDNNGLNGESIKESVFDDIQLTEKMKYNGNQSVGGGQGVINNVLQSITGHDHVLQYTVDSQDKLNLNNNGLYSADTNQGMIEQQNVENNNYVAMVGQNNYENDLYDYQQNLGNLGPISQLGQNIQSTMVHHIGAPYNAAQNIIGYGPGGDVLGQKLVIQSVPVIYQRPYSYHQRITARRPMVVG